MRSQRPFVNHCTNRNIKGISIFVCFPFSEHFVVTYMKKKIDRKIE